MKAIVLVLLLGVFSAVASSTATAASFNVQNTNDSGTDSLRDAINAVNAGQYDVIDLTAIANGTITLATDLPTITQPVEIKGSGVTIDGGGGRSYGLVLQAGSDGSSIHDLTIQGFTHDGVQVFADNASLSNVTSTDNGWYGVELYGSNGSSVKDSTITNNNFGGMHLLNATNSTIGASGHGNDISSNSGSGQIYLDSGGAGSSSNTIDSNTFSNFAGAGVVINNGTGNSENTIHGNQFSSTAANSTGILIQSPSNRNSIQGNTFDVKGKPIDLGSSPQGNDGQPAPVLNSIDRPDSSTATVHFDLTGIASVTNENYLVQFYTSDHCGSAQALDGSMNVSTDSSGTATDQTYSLSNVDPSAHVTAIATDVSHIGAPLSSTGGDSSEISNCLGPASAGTPDLTVSVPDDTRIAGGGASQTSVTVTNNGTAGSTGGHIVFTIPTGGKLFYGSGGCGTSSTNVLTCTLPDIAAGSNTSIDVSVGATADEALGPYTLHADVSDPNEASGDTGNDGDDGTITVSGSADLSVSSVVLSAANGSSVTAGASGNAGKFNAVATVANGGPSDSHGYKVTYHLSSADVSFDAIANQPANCLLNGSGDLECTGGANLAGPSSSAAMAPIVVVAAHDALGSRSVTATVSTNTSGVTDPTPSAAANSNSGSINVVASADLSISGVTLAAANGSSVTAGASGNAGKFTAVATVANGGPSDSHGYKVTYHLSNTDLSFDTAANQPVNCSVNGSGDLECTSGANLAGPSSSAAMAPIVVVAAHDALGSRSVTATVSTNTSGVTDPTPSAAANSNSGSVTVVAHTDLSASSANSPATNVVAGHPTLGQFTTTPTVTNGGPSDSHAYTLTLHLATDPSDPNTAQAAGDISFAPLSVAATNAGCVMSGADVVCTRTNAQSISSVGTNTFTFPVIAVNAGAQALGRYFVQATATPTTSGVTDPDGSSMTPTSVNVVARANLTVTKSGASFGTFLVGSESTNLVYANGDSTKNSVTYTITINAASGLSWARHVTITDDVNAGVAPAPNSPPAFTATICGPSLPAADSSGCQPLGASSIDVGTMTPNSSRTYTVTAVANQALRSVSPNPGSPRGGYLSGNAPPSSLVGNVVNIGSTSPDFSATGTNYIGASYPKQRGSGNRAFIATAPNAPTNVQAFAGSFNAGVSWQAPVQDGGQSIGSYTVTAHPSTGSAISKTLSVPPNHTIDPNFNQAGSTYQFVFPSLSNTASYTFTVTATNPVGTSADSTASNSVSPSINNSAFVFNNVTGLSQQTGAAPTAGDPQVESQTFGTGTTGLGTIQECTTSAACSNVLGSAAPQGAAPTNTASITPTTFCGGVACIGVPVVTKLSTAAVGGRYTIILQYGKQIISGTGTSFTVYFLNPGDPTQTSPKPIPNCPNKGTPTVPACVVKIVSQPAANPALKVQLSVAPNVFDPVSGTRK